jgi:uncharacterized coiled-coil DUF342 family protein
MDFNALKDKYKDNEGLMSDLSQIESEYTTLRANKDNAVDEVKKFKGFKHTIAETFGLDKEISIDDLQGNLKGKLSEYQEKIDSFKNNASSKEQESAQFKEEFGRMQRTLNEMTESLTAEKALNKRNELKDKFSKALSNANIKSAEAQEIAIDAYIGKVEAVEDLEAFAKSIAEQRPFLTSTSHKGGNGSFTTTHESKQKSLADFGLKDRNSRVSSIQAMIDASPIKG